MFTLFFHFDFPYFPMDSDKKYKKGGESSCAVNSCTNNRRKLQLWTNLMCEIHKEVHDQCPCLIPFKFHTMPTDEHTKLEWIKAINRKIRPKKIMYVLNIYLMECRRNVILFQNLNWNMNGKLHPVDANCSVRKLHHNIRKLTLNIILLKMNQNMTMRIQQLVVQRWIHPKQMRTTSRLCVHLVTFFRS